MKIGEYMDDKYLSVTALTRYIKYKLDNDNNLQEVYLKGEISKSEKTDETPSSQYNNQNNFYEKIDIGRYYYEFSIFKQTAITRTG